MPDIEFRGWPKIARLNRDIIITEKIDGTNAAIGVTEDGIVYAQSRTRIITPENDNYGFAKWVESIADYARSTLGPGLHFGEWWGNGIQRNYGQATKRFSLFNVARWADLGTEGVIGVVPVLYEGPYEKASITLVLANLKVHGSYAAPGFMEPEGIVIYHTAAKTMFKVTLEHDEKPKGSTE